MNSPPILEPILVDWEVHWGLRAFWILTHGQVCHGNRLVGRGPRGRVEDVGRGPDSEDFETSSAQLNEFPFPWLLANQPQRSQAESGWSPTIAQWLEGTQGGQRAGGYPNLGLKREQLGARSSVRTW